MISSLHPEQADFALHQIEILRIFGAALPRARSRIWQCPGRCFKDNRLKRSAMVGRIPA
ncbi:MAG: hypothetical protein ACLVEJ_12780 [Parabacteroides sp.]